MVTDSLCFKEAHDARTKGEITLAEYLSYLLAHFGCTKHDADSNRQMISMSFPAKFAHEIRELALDPQTQPLDQGSIKVLHSMFFAARTSDIASVRKNINLFTGATLYYLSPLQSIATTTGEPDLLRLCFENGYRPSGWANGYLEIRHLLESRVQKNPSTAWLDVLFDFDVAEWRTDRQRLSEQCFFAHFMYMGGDCSRWAVEHGAHPATARGLFARGREDKEVPDAPTMQILLDAFGIDWFQNSGALQLAVRKEDYEVVKMLVEAGADINESPAEFEWLHDYREGGIWALSALHNAMYRRSEKMIKYLSEYGAKMTLKDLDIPDTYNQLPERFWHYPNLIVDLGAVEEEDTIDYAIFRLGRIALE